MERTSTRDRALAAVSETTAPGQRIRLLWIEDDEVDRMAFERFVRREDLPYDYRFATSLADAQTLLEEHGFDVVVTDYHLGDGDALEVLELARELPVIVITGAGGEDIAVRAMRSGAYDYLTKDSGHRHLRVLPVTIDNACRHHASEARARMLQQALTSINDAIYITDADGRLVFVNDTFCATYGYRAEEILGRRNEVLWSDDGEPQLLPHRPADLPERGERGECRHRRRDGSSFAVLLSRSPILDESGRCVAAVGAARDISDRKRWETALRDSEERYAVAAAGANDGLWDWNLRTRQVYFSERWKATLGLDDEELRGAIEDWLERVHPEDTELLEAQIEAHVEGRTPHFENEHRIRTRDGEYIWVQTRGLAVRDDEGRAYRMAGSLRDVTDRKRVEEQLTHAALHDALTGLPNRALFMDRLDNAVKRHQRRSDHFFGVIFLDLDRFKVINDSLGHVAGDLLLQAIAERLTTCLRLGDTVARMGGDEFAVLLEGLDDEDEVHQVAGRIQQELTAPFTIDGHEFFTAASLGVALSSTGYERAEDLLRDADTAMYRAKSQGRVRQVVFAPDMHERAVALMHLENDLRRAVDRGEFEVYYQPIVALSEGSLQGFEALVRWPHPERGLVAPGDFLPLARETGLLPAIGWWVLEQACRQMRAWQKRFAKLSDVAVSVNLDGGQLSSREMIDRVEQALATSGLEPESLRLEITEGMLIEHPEVVTSILARLRSQGIAFHIDDFGTGYSSLSQLHRFPVDALKIDRSFIAGMGSEGEEIVRTIVSLAHNLGLEVMAEGIETVDQLVRLRDLGCEMGQGFLFSKPVSAGEAERRLLEDGGRFTAIFSEANTRRSAGPPGSVVERA